MQYKGFTILCGGKLLVCFIDNVPFFPSTKVLHRTRRRTPSRGVGANRWDAIAIEYFSYLATTFKSAYLRSSKDDVESESEDEDIDR